MQPVHWLPHDDVDVQPERRGLALSGGGYRAMLFHLGALWRLNDAALLTTLDRVSSVSGGSITAATLGLAWPRLAFDEGGRAQAFADEVVGPLRRLAGRTIDAAAVVEGLLPGVTIAERLAHAYAEALFGDATLQDLPDAPRFVLNATNLESGSLWRFTKTTMADWRVGRIANPTVRVADAVAASSAFPPVLSPFRLDTSGARWESEPGSELTSIGFRDEVRLSDGGVYDNLGLETVWKKCREVLISDAGGHLADDPDPPANWPEQTLRVLHVIDHQVRSLRKRQAIASLASGQRGGTYWGVRSHVSDYGLADVLPCPPDATEQLAGVATRLCGLPDAVQERLVNWGYAMCDTALRRWIDPTLGRGSFPYPARGVG